MNTDNTTFEIAQAGPSVAVLGIGSIEQHSAHLPIDTDYVMAREGSRVIAERMGMMCLPALPYSVCLEHRGFAGVICLRPDTLRVVIWNVAESAAQWGVKRLVLVNFHGGNFILNPTAREWNMDGRSPRILPVEFFAGVSSPAGNLHACEMETSVMLHLDPGRVHMDRAQDFVPAYLREDLTALGMKRISPRGVWGNPTRATAEKGQAWWEEGITCTIERIGSLLDATAEG